MQPCTWQKRFCKELGKAEQQQLAGTTTRVMEQERDVTFIF
jgi:hypothetical protein